MRRVARTIVGVAVAALVMAAVWFFLVRTEGPSPIAGLAPAGSRAFAADGALPPGPSRAVYAADGGRLAVLDRGQLAVASQGQLVGITPATGNVVDAAWFRSSDTLLVAEGPIPTGGLSVVQIDGKVRGTIALQPSIGFGHGYGMAIAPGNKRAIATAIERPALSPADERHLVEIDLTTGAVRDVTPSGGDNEEGPHFVDESTVFATSGQDAVLIDIATGQQRVVALQARAVGVIGGEWLVYAEGDGKVVRARSRGALGSPPVDLATLPPGSSAVDVNPLGGRLVAAVTEVQPDGASVPRLREVTIRPVPATGR